MSPLLILGFVALVLNAAYLAAGPDASLLYYFNIALHPALGLGLGAAVTVRWRREGAAGARLTRVALLVLGVGLLLGLGVLILGAGRAQAPLVLAHVSISIVGAGLLGLDLWQRVASRTSHPWAVRSVLLLCVAAGLIAPAVARSREATSAAGFRIENPTRPPATMTEEPAAPDGPFAPSSATTTTNKTIPSDFFLTSESCGRCHTDIYEQWNESAHHFSSFNNQWYRRSIEYMQSVVGTQPAKWCAGCHDHAVFFNGQMDRPVEELIDSPEAHAGLGCTSCHSVVHVGSTMGQGHFTIEYPPLHDLATSDQPLLRWAHDLLLHLAPAPHRETFLKPFHTEQSAEFCSSCHKVHLDVPVNDYRWIRGFNEYDNWQASGVSGQGARSFYYPESPQTCRSCHMPLVRSDDPAADDGFVRSHRFPAANTALPYVNGHDEQLRIVEEFLRANQITVDVFAITRATAATPAPVSTTSGQPALSSTFAVGEESFQAGPGFPIGLGPEPAEVVGPLGDGPVTVRRGESVRVEVVVRTRNVGHFFPGGTVDAVEAWVELEAVDETGRVLLHSGAVAEDGRGPVDPSAHFYRSLQLDGHGNPINKRNAWATRSVAYVRLIPPGAADTVHYRLDIPEDAGDEITLRAKVNYRKFAWWLTQWAYAGERDPSQPLPDVTAAYDDGAWVFTGDTSGVSGAMKSIPDIPITVMAEDDATLSVANPATASETSPTTAEGDLRARGRWNDYGIGLLLQGDLRGAESAFREVMRIDPSYPDGPVNVARALLQQGEVEDAVPLLEQALALKPDLARAHFFMGTARRSLGEYEQALEHLQISANQYPRDRVVLGQIGRLQFLERRYDEAIATFQSVLSIDPEDLDAHYNLMLSHQGAGNQEEAARERALYERFKADESSQAITGDLRRTSPEDNNERQAVHEHRHLTTP